jgi:hypothetical protein
VRVYHPMAGLHGPVVVDTTAPNFEGVNLTVHCVPGDYVNRQQAGNLCQRVGTLFENQGATVLSVAGEGSLNPADIGLAPFRPEELLDDDPVEEEEEPEPLGDLTVELRGRQIHAARHPWSWLFCVASFTLLPGVTESTFAQDVLIRDANGFLLSSKTLKGRLVQRFGAGPWIGNAMLNLSREKGNKIKRSAAEKDLSNDLYGQLSQSVFNAKIQWEVLQEARAAEGAP